MKRGQDLFDFCKVSNSIISIESSVCVCVCVFVCVQLYNCMTGPWLEMRKGHFTIGIIHALCMHNVIKDISSI